MAETSESVLFDVIWDIILSYYVLSGALHYFAVTFFCSLPLAGSSLILSYPILNLSESQKQATIICLCIGVIICCAQYSIAVYKVPQQIGFRLSIGLLGCVFLLIGEMLLWPALYWRWSILREFYEQSDAIAIGVLVALIALVATMPCLLIVAEEAAKVDSSSDSSDVDEEQSKEDEWLYDL